MSVLIKLRRGSASDWSTQNVVLASGEPGFEIDTGRLKIGDGSSAWNSLSYASVIPSGFLSGSGININLGANGSTATISVSGLNSSYISDFDEAVDDRIGSGLFVAGTGINLNYNDSGNTFTVSVTGLISNPGDNRILTSRDSTNTGIDAESNLTFDGSLLNITGDIQANYIFGDLDGPIIYDCKNNTGSTIPKGTPVYISGHFANGKVYVAPARSDDSSKMPALGLLGETLIDDAEGHVYMFGALSNVDTQTPGYTVGQTLYVAPTGGLTTTRPTASDHLIQNIGRIARVGDTNGRLLVLGPARTNDIPNSGNFVSLTINNSGVPVGSGSSNYSARWISANTLGTGILYDNGTSVGIGTNNPQTFVHISGDFPAVGNILRLQNNNSSQKTYVDFRIGSSANFEDHFFIRRSGVDVFGIDTSNRGFFPSNCTISATKQFQSYNNANAFLEFQQAASPASAANFRLGYLSDANMIFLASYVERMRLTGAGNLGIGTTSPSAQLHVVGNAIVSSGLTTPTGNFTTSISGALLDIDNIRIDGNTITSTNSNGNLIIQTTGTGALQRTLSGNTRGQYAVDLQSSRVSSNQVAGGDYCVIGGGRNNSINGDSHSVIGGGRNNSISTYGSYNNTIAGGYYNQISMGASARGFFIGGGENNEINIPAGYTFGGVIVGGASNTIGGDYNYAPFIGGGSNNSVLGFYNHYAFIGGGSNNIISTVGGGYSFEDSHCVIVGGSNNICSGDYSAILGGKNNNDGGRDNVFILGSNITSTQANTTYVESLDVAISGDIDVLRINKFYHNNLSVASGLSDSDLLVAIINPSGTSSTEVISGSTLRSSLLNQPATLRFRQGTEAERLLITPASGEPIWTTDSQRFYIGDGTTVGGDLIGPIYKSGTGSNSIVTSFSSTSAASGDYSVVGGGNGNIIKDTADGSVIGGGYDNTVWGPKSFIGGGENNTTGSNFYTNVTHHAICGGYNNSIDTGTTSYYDPFPVGGCFIGGGQGNTMIGDRNYHVICGGYSNYIDAQNYSATTIVGGYNNTISGDYSGGSFIGGGQENTITRGFHSVIAGGYSNNITLGDSPTIGGGRNNTASAGYSTVPGGYQAKTTRYGELSHAAGKFANNGDAQHTVLIARKTTTNATANQVLFLNDSSARLILPAKTTWTFEVKLSAYNDSDSAGAGWIFRGAIRRNGSNGTAIIGSIIEENWKDAAMNSTNASVVADDAFEALEIRVTGIASKNIRWVAVVDISQVSYGTP